MLFENTNVPTQFYIEIVKCEGYKSRQFIYKDRYIIIQPRR